MRRLQLEKTQKYIQLLEKLHEAILQDIDPSIYDITAANEHLLLCHEKAIEVGEFIEGCEGVGHPTVATLEEYCEAVYEINEVLLSGSVLDRQSVGTKLDASLEKIVDSANKDISQKKLAVFLPYKASMWDSLESVWKRYQDDSGWDAVVVPIPYFEKNQDGSFKELIYEGELYPDYVPVVSYEQFNIEEEHPDEIYIHNPYDDINHVTSVHPYFYSSSIKQYTDKLIYIPYFVLAEPDLNNEQAMEHLMMYAVTPAAIHAHEVIVQSENMRLGYIECLTKYFGEDTRGTWEAKIKGTGSPKLEKVRNLKKEEMDVPPEWLDVIKKPDGSWKKVVFYNTGVTAIINNKENYIDKMADVFKIFYENREKVALLWRPHPLMEATIESIIPDKLEEYKRLRDEYRAAGWGIYDDTPDMDRAIAISDAYYGDASSLVQLCQEREMPVMIQNVNVIEGE